MENLFSLTNITWLPPEMLVVIFKKLNKPDIKSARLVCSSWRSLIDRQIPLTVKVDNREPGNSLFVRKVIKEGVTVNNLLVRNSALASPKQAKRMKKMKITGRVHSHLFINEVLKFQNLKILIISGEALLSRLQLKKTISLPRLERLNISSAFQSATSIPLSIPELQKIVAKNTTDFLRNLWCPDIVEIIIDGDVDQAKLRGKYDWKYNALPDFLAKYCKSLRKILVGESSILKPITRDANQMTCSSLRSVHFSFYGNSMQELYWGKFITGQRQLEHLNLGSLWYDGTSDILSRLPVTMRYLALYWNLNTDPTMNMGAISHLVNLERLELTYDGVWGKYLSNFGSLKACKKLKILVLEQALIPACDLEKLPTLFPNLEVLYLFQCGDAKMLLESPEGPFGVSQSALTEFLWSLDDLLYLFVYPEDFLGDETTVTEMKNEISKVAKSKHKVGSVLSKGYHIGLEPEYSVNISY